MGSIKGILAFFDQADPLSQAQHEAVTALGELGYCKTELFLCRFPGLMLSGPGAEVPVAHTFAQTWDVYAYSAAEAGNIASVVSQKLATALHAPQASLAAAVAATFTSFLASDNPSDGFYQFYPTTEGTMLMRVDVQAWYRQVKSAGIRARMERVVAVAAIKSSVDLAKLNLDAFLATYQQQLRAAGLPGDEAQAALQQARSIYEGGRSPRW
jgi:hypothetical protein